jgi:hypothetical protein
VVGEIQTDVKYYKERRENERQRDIVCERERRREGERGRMKGRGKGREGERECGGGRSCAAPWTSLERPTAGW